MVIGNNFNELYKNSTIDIDRENSVKHTNELFKNHLCDCFSLLFSLKKDPRLFENLKKNESELGSNIHIYHDKRYLKSGSVRSRMPNIEYVDYFKYLRISKIALKLYNQEDITSEIELPCYRFEFLEEVLRKLNGDLGKLYGGTCPLNNYSMVNITFEIIQSEQFMKLSNSMNTAPLLSFLRQSREFILKEAKRNFHKYKKDGDGYNIVEKLIENLNNLENISDHLGNNLSPKPHIPNSNIVAEQGYSTLSSSSNSAMAQTQLGNRIPPLYLACEDGNVERVKLLLEQGVDVNESPESEQTPLYTACFFGHEEIVKLLLEYKADVNRPRYTGCTPLMIASGNGYETIVELLLNFGADINKRGQWGFVPISNAASYGKNEIVELLLNRGADVNIVDERYGANAFYMACQNGHKIIVDLLIKKNPNYVALKNGITPLSAACKKGHVEIADLLLANYPVQHEINKKDHKGESLFTIIQGLSKMYPSPNKFTEMVTLLRRYGAVDVPQKNLAMEESNGCISLHQPSPYTQGAPTPQFYQQQHSPEYWNAFVQQVPGGHTNLLTHPATNIDKYEQEFIDEPSTIPTMVNVPLPERYKISDRYTAGPVFTKPSVDAYSDSEIINQPTIVLNSLKNFSSPVLYNRIPINVRGLNGTLLSVGYPLNEGSVERVSFVYAGRRGEARVPEEHEGGRVIIVCPKADLRQAESWVGAYRDVLIIDNLEGGFEGEEGLITSRRLAVLRYTRALNIKDYIEMDDNIEHFHISPHLLQNQIPSTWAEIYELFRKSAENHDSAYVSARTYRPHYGLPNASNLKMLEENSIGSKIAYTNNSEFFKKLPEESFDCLLPKRKSVWGEDVWKWRALSRLGMKPAVLDYSVMNFSRVSGRTQAACAKSLGRKSDYWLDTATQKFYESEEVNEIEKAVYFDMKAIVERDQQTRLKELTALDSLDSSERTKQRLKLLNSLNMDYKRVVEQLYKHSDEEHLLQILRENNGCFGIGKLPENFFEMVDRWLREEWRGKNDWLASGDVKIRLIFEAVVYLGFSDHDDLERNFLNYLNKRGSGVPKATSDLYQLLVRECKIHDKEGYFAPISLISDDALKTFLKFKELEIKNTTNIDERPPHESKEVLTFVMRLGGGKINLEPLRVVFDSQRRMKQILGEGEVDSTEIFREIGVKVTRGTRANNSPKLVIESLEDCRQFIKYFENQGELKIGQHDILLLPVSYVPNAVDSKKRKRENSVSEPNGKQSTSPFRKMRKMNFQETDHREVQGLSKSPTKTRTTIGSRPSVSQTVPIVIHPVEVLQMNKLGFLSDYINKSLNSVLQAVIRKEQEILSPSAKNIQYPYTDKIRKLLLGDVSLQGKEYQYILDHKLKGYQRESADAAEVAWKSGLKGFLLASDMGTGKTMIMLELAFRRILRGENVIFIAPDAILEQLRAEMQFNLTPMILKAIEEELKTIEGPGHLHPSMINARKNKLKDSLRNLLLGIEQSSLSDKQKQGLRELVDKVYSTIKTDPFNSNMAFFDWVKDRNPLVTCNPFSSYSACYLGTITFLSSPKELLKKVSTLKPGLIIFDEAARLHTRNNGIYKNFRDVLNDTTQQTKVLLSTGTPLENNLSELSTLIHFLISKGDVEFSQIAEKERGELLKDAIHAYKQAGNLSEIDHDQLDDYLKPILDSFIAQEVYKLIIRNLFYRVTKRDKKVLEAFNQAVPREVPIKQSVILEQNHSQIVQNAYNRFKNTNENQKNFLEAFRLAGNILVHPIFDTERWKGGAEVYNTLAKTLSEDLVNYTEEEFSKFIGQSKLLQQFNDDINSHEFSGKGPFVVFVESIAVGHIIRGILTRKFGGDMTAFMTGDDNTGQKGVIQSNFKNGKLDALVLNYKTGGVGLDLANGKTLMIIQKPFNPGLEMQAKARINRVGREGNVFVVDYTTPTSVSKHLEAIHRKKKDLFTYIFDEEETPEGINITDRSPLNERNFEKRFGHFMNMLLSMINFDGQLSDEKLQRLSQLKAAFIEIADRDQVITSFRSALPKELWQSLEPYTFHSLPNEDKGRMSFYKILQTFLKVKEGQITLNQGKSIPKELFVEWEKLRGNLKIRPEYERAYRRDLIQRLKLNLTIFSENGTRDNYTTGPNNTVLKVLRKSLPEGITEYRLCQEKGSV